MVVSSASLSGTQCCSYTISVLLSTQMQHQEEHPSSPHFLVRQVFVFFFLFPNVKENMSIFLASTSSFIPGLGFRIGNFFAYLPRQHSFKKRSAESTVCLQE